ncbi:hypothetical protein L204_102795 [Cryptococcus depauperatus]
MTEHTGEQLPLWQDEPGADHTQRRRHTLAASGTGDEPGVDVQSQRDEQTYGHLRGGSRIEAAGLAGESPWETAAGRRREAARRAMASCRRRQLGRREGVDGAIWVRACEASTADRRRLHPLAVEDALEAAAAPRSKLDFYKDHLYLQLLVHRPGGRDERSELGGSGGLDGRGRPHTPRRGIHGARPEEHPERVYAARRDTRLAGRRASRRRARADIRPSARPTLAPAPQRRRRAAGPGDPRHRGGPRGRARGGGVGRPGCMYGAGAALTVADGNRPPPPHPLLAAHPSPPCAEAAAACVLRRAGPGRTADQLSGVDTPRDDRQSALSLLALSSHATPLVAAQAATLGFFSPLTKVYVEDVIDHLEMVTGSLEQFAATCDRLTDYVFTNASMERLSIVTVVFLPLTFIVRGVLSSTG